MIALITDTGCGLTQQQLRLYGIREVPAYINFGDQSRLSCDVSYQDVVDWNSKNKDVPKVTDATVEDWQIICHEALQEADEALIVHSPASISTVHNNLTRAVLDLDYNLKKRIRIVDPQIAGYGLGILCVELIGLIERGYSLDKLIPYIERHHEKVFTSFFIGRPDHLRKSGQLGYMAAFLLTLLNLKPIIGYKNGRIVPMGQAIGVNRAMTSILNETGRVLDRASDMMKIAFVYSYTMEDTVAEMRQMASEWGMNAYHDEGIQPVGITEFTVAGPSSVGVVVWPS